VNRDITERKQAERETHIRVQQQAAVARLSELALTGRDLDTLMADAVTTLARTLQVEYTKVLELVPAGDALMLRAGTGWSPGLVGRATVPATLESQAGYTLQSARPVIVEDLRTETRFSGPPLLHEHQVVSGLSVIIHGQERPFGVLGAHTVARRTFTANDANFLQAVANMLGSAIERERTEVVLRNSEARLRAIFDNTLHLFFLIDRSRVIRAYNKVASHWAQRVFGKPLAAGRPIDEYLPDGDGDTFAEHFDTALRGESVRVERRLLVGDSEPWIEAYYSPVRDPGGEVTGVFVSIQEITERKRVEEERARLSAAVEQAGDSIMITDTDGRIVYVNPAWERLAGYSRAETIGKVPLLLNSGQHDAEFFEAIRATITRGELWSGHVVNRRKDGSLYEVEALISPVRDPSGHVINYVELSRDVTHECEMKEALRASEARFRGLLESAPDAMLVVDRNDHIIAFANAQAESLFGYTRDELLGQTIEILVPERFREHHVALRRAYSADPQPRAMGSRSDVRGRRKDGSEFLADIMLGPLEMNQELAVLAIVRDITAQVHAQEDLARLTAELEQRVHERTLQLEAANQELEAFSYSVSHDLRAPLRAIDGFTRALLEDYSERIDEQGQHYLRRVASGTERMGLLINDLLQLARVSRSEMSRSSVDLTALAHSLAGELSQAHPDRRVQWVIADGLTVEGDPRLLRLGLENLLGNAWKYTSKTADARIEVGSMSSAECELPNADSLFPTTQSVFFVRDNGAGFDMAYADKLFGAFQRLHSSTEFEGTGVGLATVKRIVARHGGRIWATAAVNHGATFYFTL
jgi:PAS domain S-box-containing protein